MGTWALGFQVHNEMEPDTFSDQHFRVKKVHREKLQSRKKVENFECIGLHLTRSRSSQVNAKSLERISLLRTLTMRRSSWRGESARSFVTIMENKSINKWRTFFLWVVQFFLWIHFTHKLTCALFFLHNVLVFKCAVAMRFLRWFFRVQTIF